LNQEFTLITGRTRSQGDGLHQGRESDAYRQATHLVEMNREDMALLGVGDGDIVSVSTPAGSTAVPVAAGDLPRGMIFMAMGPTANLLIGGATAGTGMPPYKGQIAEVEAT
jgi:formylmethanofuran dehydrogenase subunit D